MKRITMSKLAKLTKNSPNRTVEQAKAEILKEIPFEVTFNEEVIFKVVPRHWRNPAFPIH